MYSKKLEVSIVAPFDLPVKVITGTYELKSDKLIFVYKFSKKICYVMVEMKFKTNRTRILDRMRRCRDGFIKMTVIFYNL